MSAEPAREFWRGTMHCKCGWLLPCKSAVSICCFGAENHDVALIMYCPQCGVAFEVPANEMERLQQQ